MWVLLEQNNAEHSQKKTEKNHIREEMVLQNTVQEPV